MIKIIDYDSGLGGLTHGLEDGNNFVVLRNLKLNENNQELYNATHTCIHKLTNNPATINDFDMFTASPFFGDKLSRRGMSNFDDRELNECLAYISLHLPRLILISVYGSAITPLQIDSTVTETYDGIPTNDLIIGKLKDMGYTCQNIIFDTSTYILPQAKIVSLYFAWKNGDKIKPLDIPRLSVDTVKSYENGIISEWLKKPVEGASKYCKKNFTKKDICSKIKPGDDAKHTSDISVTSGYIRLDPYRICPDLGVDLYKISSSKPCIHPTEDRPLTIAEGARLSGLSDEYVKYDNASKKEMASMIFRSVSPLISYRIRLGLLNSIG